jgi:molecular chaperone DnaK
VYQQAGAAGAEAAANGSGASASSAAGDDVIDAEFTESK